MSLPGSVAFRDMQSLFLSSDNFNDNGHSHTSKEVGTQSYC